MMTVIKSISGGDKTYSYGEDEHGEYGSIFLTDEEEQVEPFVEEDQRLARMVEESEVRARANHRTPAET